MSRERDEHSMGTADFLAVKDVRQDLRADGDRHMDAAEREREERRMMVDPDARMDADRAGMGTPDRGLAERVDMAQRHELDRQHGMNGQGLAEPHPSEHMPEHRMPEPMRNAASGTAAMAHDAAMEHPGANQPMGTAQQHVGQHEQLEPLFDSNASQSFRSRWSEVQIGFVDDPRQAVKKADELVAQVMHSLAESFARQRANIEHDVGGEQLDTEKMRVALRRYRSFFERLLTL